MATAKVMPHDTTAEQAFLGALLIDPAQVGNGLMLIEEDDFFHARNGVIFNALITLFNKNIEIDNITLSNQLKELGKLKESGGVEYINSLLEKTPTSANLEHYAKIVRDKSILRSMIRISGEIGEMAFNEELDIEDISNKAESALFQITDRNITKSYEDIQTVMKRTINLIQQMRSGTTGLSTGFIGLDKLTGGFQGGQLIVIAGRPGSGKTAFCLNMATRIALAKKGTVLFFSLEMQKHELVLRILCSEARIDGNKIKHGLISRKDMQKLVMAANNVYNASIVIDDKVGITINEARAKSRRIKNEKGELGIIIFDYMQLVEGPKDIPRHDRYNIISDVSRSLKHLAKELDVPVIALSQLSRKIEDRADRRPMLSDLRESGAIEQDADLVAFIHRNYIYTHNEEEKNIAELMVLKQRSGNTGSIPLVFFGEYMRFEDRDTREEH